MRKQPKQKPHTKRQLRELQKMVRELHKVPPEQRDEHAKEFQKRSARLSRDVSDEIKRLREQQ
jgi:hypothetical protein